MLLIRLLIPLLIIAALVVFLIKSIKSKDEPKVVKDNSLDDTIEELKTKIVKAEEKASQGIVSAHENIAKYKQQLSELEKLKTKTVETL